MPPTSVASCPPSRHFLLLISLPATPKSAVNMGSRIPTEQPGTRPNPLSLLLEKPEATGLTMLGSTGSHLLFLSY